MTVQPMRANPGAIVAPTMVVGRDRFIASLWERLDQQSLVLSAPRRMGKTCIIRKMEAETPTGKLAVYRDLENVRTPLEFVSAILEDVDKYLSIKRGAMRRARQLLTQIGGTELVGFKLPDFAAPHWKNLLTATIADLVENQDKRVILLWDEIPYMLDNLGDEMAKEMLDTLRSLRQTYPDVRMIFTGSIGLHHVITRLRRSGYKNDPINDMYTEHIPPLSLDDAITLTRSLLLGENIITFNQIGDLRVTETVRTIAESVDCIPFYIHHLVLKLKQRGTSDPAMIPEIIDDCLRDPENSWRMDHYQERIENYYDPDSRTYALGILDCFADSSQSLSFDEVFNRLTLDTATGDREKARDTLRLLQRDYYLQQNSDKKYAFRFPLIKRYWEFSRG